MLKKLIYTLLFIQLTTTHAQPTQEWAARYQRPQFSSASRNFLALDKLGNSYVLGQIYNNSTLSDVVLIKYNSSGDTVWTRVYNNPSNDDDFPNGISVDSLGNAYIAVTTGISSLRMATIKYNPSGSLQWVKIYAAPGNTNVGANDITMDMTGNIYVTGAAIDIDASVTIKYNSIGDSLWVRLKQETGYSYYGPHIKADANNVYTGIIKVNNSNNLDMFLVVKHDLNGNEQWTAVHNNNSGFNSFAGLAVGSSGNCFIAAKTLSGYTTIKFNTGGVEQWTRTYTNSIGEQVFAIAADVNGNCYITGGSSVGGSNYDYLTIKYNSIGDSVWIRRYNGPGNGNDEAYDLILDDSANVYITGRSNGTGTSRDYATIKYNTNGVQQWLARYNGPLGNGEDIAYAIAIDNNRNVFVTGISDRGSFMMDYATVKYSQFVGINPVSNNIPKKFNLYQNYPNPFNPNTRIRFNIPEKSFISLKVYNVIVNEVKEIIKNEMNAGEYETDFIAEDLSSGVYFYTIRTGSFTETKKMICLK